MKPYVWLIQCRVKKNTNVFIAFDQEITESEL